MVSSENILTNNIDIIQAEKVVLIIYIIYSIYIHIYAYNNSEKRSIHLKWSKESYVGGKGREK